MGSEPMLQDVLLPKSRWSGKVLVFVSLLAGLGLIVYVGNGTAENSNVSMAAQYMQPSRTQQFQPAKAWATPPAKAWQSMQPARAQYFRQAKVAATSDDADAASDNPGRRAALSGLTAAASVMVPAVANAGGRFNVQAIPDGDTAEDVIQRQLEAQRRDRDRTISKMQRTPEQIEKEESAKFQGVAAAGAVVLFSLPFFFPNLQRLATKVASGGQDDGYGDASPRNSRRTVTGKRGPRR
eukprot:gnl/MRDRNA2_/MRDRNA2_89667_c0_seq1.p1 gnl/MRDRNA2_/MRDRNA2_89667_c0~~gnl/MRDRNA2_/MRDRNA2_89667_c0_seq1.p1  ORF type:complete len:239 (-),score=51.38 gnl/MRDRNA2_/MRDRNA2_89667_c0_seq1:254-970(-)